jgi:hypothetical protein
MPCPPWTRPLPARREALEPKGTRSRSPQSQARSAHSTFAAPSPSRERGDSRRGTTNGGTRRHSRLLWDRLALPYRDRAAGGIRAPAGMEMTGSAPDRPLLAGSDRAAHSRVPADEAHSGNPLDRAWRAVVHGHAGLCRDHCSGDAHRVASVACGAGRRSRLGALARGRDHSHPVDAVGHRGDACSVGPIAVDNLQTVRVSLSPLGQGGGWGRPGLEHETADQQPPVEADLGTRAEAQPQ